VLQRNDPEALRYFLLTVHYRSPIGFDVENRCTACNGPRASRDPAEACAACGAIGEGRVVFPGVVEAERRVDYLYQALARLAAVEADSGTAPAKIPRDLVPFTRLAVEAPDKVVAALDDDLNTPVALAVLGELAKAANELADLAQRRKKDSELQRAAPFVAAQLHAALQTALERLGVLQAPAETYLQRTQHQRLAILGISSETIDARLAERTAARLAKDFTRADALRKELDARGIEIADSPEGSTWRIASL
jgi:cysteinyl-tRNA synthetase